MIHKHLNFAVENSRWLIGKGNISFWKDKWHNIILYYDNSPLPNISIKDAFSNEFMINNVINNLSGIDDICLFGSEDRFVLTLNSNGTINMSDIYNAIRIKKPTTSWYNYFWANFITTKLSIFTWKLIHNYISIDTNCQINNVSLASKCCFCNMGNVENMGHLFLYGDTAKATWDFFMRVLDINLSFSSLINFLKGWLVIGKANTQLGNCILLLGTTIPCCIWMFMNNKKYGAIDSSMHMVFHKVYTFLHDVIIIIKSSNRKSLF